VGNFWDVLVLGDGQYFILAQTTHCKAISQGNHLGLAVGRFKLTGWSPEPNPQAHTAAKSRSRPQVA
jgi:hypothetical protein